MADTFSMFQKSETPAPAVEDMSLKQGVAVGGKRRKRRKRKTKRKTKRRKSKRRKSKKRRTKRRR